MFVRKLGLSRYAGDVNNLCREHGLHLEHFTSRTSSEGSKVS